MIGVLASRPLLEGMIRERVLGLPNLKCLQGVTVDKLFSSTPGRVTGVRMGGEVLEADLVIDASGRGSHSAGRAALICNWKCRCDPDK